MEVTLSRELASGEWIEATARLDAYFSVTGSLWETRRKAHTSRRDENIIACGQIVEEIDSAFPQLAPLRALHLASVDGVPMHAEANGWYWYSDHDGRGVHDLHGRFGELTPHERTAEHLRIAPEELPKGLDREAFAAFVETLRPRWNAEAQAGIALLRSLA